MNRMAQSNIRRKSQYMTIHIQMGTDNKLDGLQCIWRHCNIGSKRALTTGVLNR